MLAFFFPPFFFPLGFPLHCCVCIYECARVYVCANVCVSVCVRESVSRVPMAGRSPYLQISSVIFVSSSSFNFFLLVLPGLNDTWQ